MWQCTFKEETLGENLGKNKKGFHLLSRRPNYLDCYGIGHFFCTIVKLPLCKIQDLFKSKVNYLFYCKMDKTQL